MAFYIILRPWPMWHGRHAGSIVLSVTKCGSSPACPQLELRIAPLTREYVYSDMCTSNPALVRTILVKDGTTNFHSCTCSSHITGFRSWPLILSSEYLLASDPCKPTTVYPAKCFRFSARFTTRFICLFHLVSLENINIYVWG